MKKIIVISVVIALVVAYCFYCGNTLLSQDATYIRRSQVMDVFETEREYFDEVAELFEESNKVYCDYDLSARKVFQTNLTDEQMSKVEKLCKEYSFNTIFKESDCLYIYYNRPFDHYINIGVCYHYDTKDWKYVYNHNYDRCPNGHHGYKIFDLMLN